MVTTRLHTADDLWTLVSQDERFELIEGELIEVSPGKRRHGVVQANITSSLVQFVKANRLGIVSTEEGFVLGRNPDTVLAPDVAFVNNAQSEDAAQYWSDIPPDLAVEVISPGNTRTEVDRKVRIYLESGVKLVWLVYPERREVIEHALGLQPSRTITGDDLLDGGEVLPGLTISLNDIFGE